MTDGEKGVLMNLMRAAPGGMKPGYDIGNPWAAGACKSYGWMERRGGLHYITEKGREALQAN